LFCNFQGSKPTRTRTQNREKQRSGLITKTSEELFNLEILHANITVPYQTIKIKIYSPSISYVCSVDILLSKIFPENQITTCVLSNVRFE
jgi:hypothetical protein